MVAIYFDESGNSNEDGVLMVGGVEPLIDENEVEQHITELWERLAARRDLDGHRGFAKFQTSGFHATSDPPEVSEQFFELMRDTPFRAYIHMTDRSSPHMGTADEDRIASLYQSLLSDLLLRFAGTETLECVFEENPSLRSLFAALPSQARQTALQKFGGRGPRNLPSMTVTEKSKPELKSIALIDYVMLAVQRWMKTGRSEDSGDWKVRNFRNIEPTLSVLYSIEHGVISSRTTRLH